MAPLAAANNLFHLILRALRETELVHRSVLAIRITIHLPSDIKNLLRQREEPRQIQALNLCLQPDRETAVTSPIQPGPNIALNLLWGLQFHGPALVPFGYGCSVWAAGLRLAPLSLSVFWGVWQHPALGELFGGPACFFPASLPLSPKKWNKTRKTHHSTV